MWHLSVSFIVFPENFICVMAVEVNLTTDTRNLLEAHNLRPLWEIEEEELGEERRNLEPELWEWSQIKETIDSIAEDVPIEELPPGFRRRVAVPVNPAYPGSVSHTMYVGVQTVSPGETAPSHRHGANALRFTINGNNKMKTAVGGEEFPMLDNDLITTPQWEWHDHINESNESVAWLDVLDLPLVFNSLNLGAEFEEHENTRQDIEKPPGFWSSQFGSLRATNRTDNEIPGPYQGTETPTPPYRFRWADCEEALANAADEGIADRYDGTCLDYVNPATGNPPLFPTFGVRAQLIHGTTDTHQHNSTEIYHVIDGTGATHHEQGSLEWGPRDIFVTPPNVAHQHEVDDTATLLAITDRPLLEGINFYHETPASL